MKELMVAISGLFGKRCTNTQKDRFICYIQNLAKETNLKCTVDTGKIGHQTCRNIYLGNVKQAKVFLTVPYDTSTRILWPNIRYYPVNARKNSTRDSISKGLDLLISLTLVTLYYLFVFRHPSMHGGEVGILPTCGLILITLLGFKTIYGWQNRNNYSRNSASIVIALECLKRQTSNEIAVALLDQSCCGFGGYHQFSKYLDQKRLKKKIIVLDCVATGSELHLHGLHTLPELDGIQNHKIRTDDSNQSIVDLFPDSIVLTGGSYINGETVVSDTRNGKDCQINLQKMEHIVDVIRRLAEGTA